MQSQIPTEIPFEQVIEALLDTDTPLNPRFLYRLSDLEADEMAEIKAVWSRLPGWRRLALMEDIEELNETDMLMSFEGLARFTLKDDEPKIRVLATRTLWDYQDAALIPTFLDMLKTDPEREVRAAAATALGRYIYAGELEEIPQDAFHQVEDVLLQTVSGTEEAEIRRAALEALGFSSRDEVSKLIEKAFASDDKQWKASALFAMGRSANQQWQPQVLSMLEHKLPLIRSEAARAAGELEIREAVPLLVELLDDPDESTRQASIWSLSQIGGDGVMDLLQRMFEKADEVDADLLESALDNLAFNEGIQLMPILDVSDAKEDDEEEDDWFEEFDLEEMDDEELFEDEEFDEDEDDDEDIAD